MAHPRSHYRMHEREPARGSTRPGEQNYRQAVVRFDFETFDQIRARAVAQQTSFSEQVRLLVEWGLEADRAA